MPAGAPGSPFAIMNSSLFELFKIGIGPSSSHTVGPMVAARRFAHRLERAGLLAMTEAVRIDLYGSLALTGKGNGTDKAVILGLCGEEPATVDPQAMERSVSAARRRNELPLLGRRRIRFLPHEDLIFHCQETLSAHPNGMVFAAFGRERKLLERQTYYSIGGGFILGEGEAPAKESPRGLPFPFRSAAELLAMCRSEDLTIWRLMLRNEAAFRSERQVLRGIDALWHTMQHSISQGLMTTGVLPGESNLRRKAPGLAARLRERHQAGKSARDPLALLEWASVYAMAVSEENAAGGRIVSAPTNAVAGIIPAVARYYERFVLNARRDGIHRFFLTAAAIGILFQENASISGADVGCQGEVGVAASMAAGGLVAARGGSSEQIERAAAIAIERHLGITRDDVVGPVQVPSIVRNAIGAVKAINACGVAMNESNGHEVSLDHVIQSTYSTGLDMQSASMDDVAARAGIRHNRVLIRRQDHQSLVEPDERQVEERHAAE
jgi:L-serine dehydratase